MPGTRVFYICVLAVLVILNGCGNDPYCPAGLSWCWAQCVDLQNDIENCGNCDEVCGLNSYCENGACVCPFGYHTEGSDCVEDDTTCEGHGLIDCDGECVDVYTDTDHCGSCGNICRFSNASGDCIDGVCEMGWCDDNWGDCNGESLDGCETGLMWDPENCGSCGHSCDLDEFCEYGNCKYEENCSDYPEICDGVDNNCNDEIDEDPLGIICDDSNDCTEDVCERGQGCVNILMVGVSCDDNSDCTENDVCQPTGSCAGTPIDADGDGYSPPPCGMDCDDNDPDVYPDKFEEGSPSSLECSDGKDNDCDGLTDQDDPDCDSWICDSNSFCDDGNACNGAEWCDFNAVPAPECRPGTPVADGTACDDRNECTINDHCENGACVSGENVPDFTPCSDDGLFCNGPEGCVDGSCVGLGIYCPNCDEDNPNCPGCGDGIVSAGEDCDHQPPHNDNCCDIADCTWVRSGGPDPQGVCTGAPECQVDVCDGTGWCTFANVADGTVCEADLTCCDGECVDTDTDESHCGSCRAACSPAETCIDGECIG